MRPSIWPAMFEDHDPGYIHRAVQAHIIATNLFEKELYLSGIGRADIYDPATREIWEIKHGGSSAPMIDERTNQALLQAQKYVKKYTKTPLCLGAAGTFTGQFVINYGTQSYLVSYDTPQDGVILYYVEKMKSYEPEAFRVYAHAHATMPSSTNNATDWGSLYIPFVFLGAVGGGLIEQTFRGDYAS